MTFWFNEEHGRTYFGWVPEITEKLSQQMLSWGTIGRE
jgi:hypothetical protein